MKSIEHKIRKARPKLKDVAPLTNAVVLSFAVGNAIIALGLWMIKADSTVGNSPIVNSILTYQVHAVIFAALAIYIIISWVRNDWNMMRRSLLFGVFVKSVWTVSLVFSIFNGGSLAVLGAWVSLLSIQMATFVFFAIPPRNYYD